MAATPLRASMRGYRERELAALDAEVSAHKLPDVIKTLSYVVWRKAGFTQALRFIAGVVEDRERWRRE